jgi:hypothetical protein
VHAHIGVALRLPEHCEAHWVGEFPQLVLSTADTAPDPAIRYLLCSLPGTRHDKPKVFPEVSESRAAKERFPRCYAAKRKGCRSRAQMVRCGIEDKRRARPRTGRFQVAKRAAHRAVIETIGGRKSPTKIEPISICHVDVEF